MRFPGQYFDSETNLNIHRDYNPVWGRYMSSDPLGLTAGINTYGYVGGNSLGFSDRLGLLPVEHYLKEWICGSKNWDEALDKARAQKMGNFDPLDPMDADNRNSAEHYIFARNLALGKIGRGYIKPILWVGYFTTGGYWAYGYQLAKNMGYFSTSSRSSYMQLYWGSKAYTDSFYISNKFKGEPGTNSCECERK